MLSCIICLLRRIDMMQISRRSMLKSVGGIGTTLTFAGFASTSEGQQRYLVNTSQNTANQVEAAGFEILTELAGGSVLLVTGPEDAVDDLEAVAGVSMALPDFNVELTLPTLQDTVPEQATVPTDPDEVYDEILWDKQIQQVREAHEHATGDGQTIAIIDTGIDHTHPDLDVDVDQSISIVEGQPDDHIGDVHFHGTHVAGTAAGNGSVGLLGTAPEATLISVRVFGDVLFATFGDILAAVEYAGEIGADVANLSLGIIRVPQDNADQYRRFFEPVANRLARDGTLLVGAAGNADLNLQQGGWLALYAGQAGVLGISATSPNDTKSFYSNYGTNTIDVGAPGGGYETVTKTLSTTEVKRPWPLNAVFSAVPDTGLVPSPYVDTTIEGEAYAWLIGTSIAAPQVTGLAALVRERNTGANARQVENAIKHGAEGTSGRGDSVLGAGRVNALKTIE